MNITESATYKEFLTTLYKLINDYANGYEEQFDRFDFYAMTRISGINLK